MPLPLISSSFKEIKNLSNSLKQPLSSHFHDNSSPSKSASSSTSKLVRHVSSKEKISDIFKKSRAPATIVHDKIEAYREGVHQEQEKKKKERTRLEEKKDKTNDDSTNATVDPIIIMKNNSKTDEIKQEETNLDNDGQQSGSDPTVGYGGAYSNNNVCLYGRRQYEDDSISIGSGSSSSSGGFSINSTANNNIINISTPPPTNKEENLNSPAFSHLTSSSVPTSSSPKDSTTTTPTPISPSISATGTFSLLRRSPPISAISHDSLAIIHSSPPSPHTQPATCLPALSAGNPTKNNNNNPLIINTFQSSESLHEKLPLHLHIDTHASYDALLQNMDSQDSPVVTSAQLSPPSFPESTQNQQHSLKLEPSLPILNKKSSNSSLNSTERYSPGAASLTKESKDAEDKNDTSNLHSDLSASLNKLSIEDSNVITRTSSYDSSIAEETSFHENTPNNNQVQSGPVVTSSSLKPPNESQQQVNTTSNVDGPSSFSQLTNPLVKQLAKNSSSNLLSSTLEESNPSTPPFTHSAPPTSATLSATSHYSTQTASANPSPINSTSSYSLENCTFNELKSILSEKLIQLSQVQNQNAQLWTLVNKQRTMIFDLQRDLDNAVEQNEKLARQLEFVKSANQSSTSLNSSNNSQQPLVNSSETSSLKTLNSIQNLSSSQVSSGKGLSVRTSSPSLKPSSYKVSRKPSTKEALSSLSSPPITASEPSTSQNTDNTASSNGKANSLSRKPVSSSSSSIITSSNNNNNSNDEKVNNNSAAILRPLSNGTNSSYVTAAESTPTTENIPYKVPRSPTVSARISTAYNLQDTIQSPSSAKRSQDDDNDDDYAEENEASNAHKHKKVPSSSSFDASSNTPRPTKPRPSPIVVVNGSDSTSSTSPPNSGSSEKSAKHLPTGEIVNNIVTTNSSPSHPSSAPLKSTRTPTHGKSSSFDFSDQSKLHDHSYDSKWGISSPRRSESSSVRPTQQQLTLYVQPEDLPSISLDISTLIGKVKSVYKPRREDPVAIINALDKETKKELWKVIKDYTSLVNLDNSIRPLLYPQVPDLPKIPERSMFQSHAPSRVDARKTALEDYFQTILSQKLPHNAAQIVCEFLSTDTIDPMDIPDTPSKCEGYLTKRGKKIRGWKVRYFIIETDSLNYYDKPGGELQGTISLRDAKLGRQTKTDTDQNSEESVEKALRHAFLLLEHRKKDYVRHVLCAESDEERDHWIDALLEVISNFTTQTIPPLPASSNPATSIDNNRLLNGSENSNAQESLSSDQQSFQTEPTSTNSSTLSVKRKPTAMASGEDSNPRAAALSSVNTQSTMSPITPNSVASTPTSAHMFSSTPTSSTFSSRLMPAASALSLGGYSKHIHESSSHQDLRPSGSHGDLDYDDGDTKEIKKSKKKSFFSFRNKTSSSNIGSSSSINNNSSNGNHAPAAPTSEFSDEFQSTPYSAVEQKPMADEPQLQHQQPTYHTGPMYPPASQLQQAAATAQLHPVSPSTSNPLIHNKALGMTLDEAVISQQEALANAESHTGSDSNGTNPNISIEGDTSLNGDNLSRRVFGIPLVDAVHLSYKDVHHCRVPSIVYRCIELLKVRDAIFEEGIFRLNGAAATIRTLKERFNNEYDVDLVNSETYYDVHAVAGLLKLYLREIPTLILSSYLAPEFRDAVEIPDVTTKILKLKSLVQELPRENKDLLCVLCSLLTEVIAHQDINKMNLRNVGIVFSLTLNISSSVLTSFLTDFDSIFGDAVPDENKSRAPDYPN